MSRDLALENNDESEPDRERKTNKCILSEINETRKIHSAIDDR